MANVNDAKYAKIGGTGLQHMDDLEIKFVQGLGATSDQINDAWKQAFDLLNPATAQTGTVSVTAGTKAVTGVGTSFTGLAVGDQVIIASELHTIAAIADDLNMTLSENHVAGAAGVGYTLVTGRQWNDAALIWLQGEGATSNNLSDAWLEYWLL